MIPMPWDPLLALGSVAGKVITDGWIAMMLGLWGAALWLLRIVLGFMDAALQPDLRAEGPGRDLYLVMYALAGALAFTLSIVQVGVALFRRDGRSIGRLLVGVGQFWLVLAGGLVYAQGVLLAASALTRALMESLLGVSTWRGWQPFEPFEVKDITDATLATVLGILSFFVVFAAVAFFLIMVVRGAALLVMVATMPIAAAGLVSDVGHAWLWKLCRWFHAMAFTPLVVVLVLGVGIKMSAGVAAGLSEGVAASVGTAFASVVLIATSTFAPLALFKLLAFVDPGTASGAAARIGWASAGGLQGLTRGHGAGGGGRSAATQQGTGDASAAESDAQAGTSDRFSTALNALTGTAPTGSSQPGSRQQGGSQPNAQQGGQKGQQGGQQQPSLVDRARGLAADGLGVFAGLGAQGAAIGADVTNQAGVGHNGYYPDFTGASPRTQHDQHAAQHAQAGSQSTGRAAQAPPPQLPVVLPPADPANPSSQPGGDPS